MRTTVTIDPDVAVQLEREMREQGLGFKEALNRALRRGLAAPAARPKKRVKLRVFNTGLPRVAIDDVTAALAWAEGDDHR